MKQHQSPYTDTFNKIWKTLQKSQENFDLQMQQSKKEADKQAKNFDQQMQASKKEADKRAKNFDQQMQASKKEADKRAKNFDQQMQESKKEADKRAKNFDQQMQESKKNFDQQMQESKKEADKRAKNFDQQMQESKKNFDQQMQASKKDFDRRIKKLEQTVNKIGSGFNDRWGRLVESLVEGKLSQLLRERGIQVEHTHPNVKRERFNQHGEIIEKKEFDIIVVNGKEVVVVEVKTTLNCHEVQIFMDDYLKDFKKYFKEYKDKILYGAVAYLKSMDEADTFAEKQGMFVIKATGDSAHIINKKNFKPKAFT